MSFVKLDSGEFPPLNKITQETNITAVSKFLGSQSPVNPVPIEKTEDEKFRAYLQSLKKKLRQGSFKGDRIVNSYDFVSCRVGQVVCDYCEDLDKVLRTNLVGVCHRGADFVLAPIEPVRTSFYEDTFEVISDLELSCEAWQQRVAIELGHPSLDNFDLSKAKHFDKVFQHALYLPSPVIVITCPDSDSAYVSVAATVNDGLYGSNTTALILFKVPVMKTTSRVDHGSWQNLLKCDSESKHSVKTEQDNSLNEYDDLNENDSHNEWSVESGIANSTNSNGNAERSIVLAWRQWNCIRTHLNPDYRVGVCLSISEELISNSEELERWTGEPVRMIIIGIDQFLRSPGSNGTVYLNHRCKEFITKIALANSLKTSFVLEAPKKQNIQEHLNYIEFLFEQIKKENVDYLRDWNDKMQPPLQPLSSNLDSSTYGVFEMDSTKYVKYREAMIEALDHFEGTEGALKRPVVAMILGAGRGPLVDAFISAIRALKLQYKFKIFALDKNPSSVTALRHKQKTEWIDKSGLIETEVVEADMRDWSPGVKADIIASELLGSFSDNELSPECIDGTWRFSTPRTISIPQEYSSYIAPICSYELYQKLYKLKDIQPYAFDQIYVVKLSNCYRICGPQLLFKFEHKNLSLPPNKRCNERYTKLTFWAKVETVCHGFAGYFSATLFAGVNLSTIHGQKTPHMDSWFPAFVPLENPIHLAKDTRLEIHFWRKESTSQVWYQWAITSPQRSRIHSQNGQVTAMSKF